VRVMDGQQISLVMSLQISLRKDRLKQVYLTYGERYVEHFVRSIKEIVRTIAQRYTSEQFFEHRKFIETTILETTTEELVSMGAKVFGFQMHNVVTPSFIDAHLQTIELNKYLIQVNQERSELMMIYAVNNGTYMAEKGRIDMSQSILTTAANEAKKELEMQEITETALTQKETKSIRAESDVEVLQVNKATENKVLNLTSELRYIEGKTKLAVVNITAMLEKQRARYQAATENLKLNSLLNETKIREGTKQIMANLTAEHQASIEVINGKTREFEVLELANRTLENEYSLLDAASIAKEIALLKAQLDANVTRLKSQSDIALINATSIAAASRSQQVGVATAGAFKALQQELSFSGNSLVHLNWLDLFELMQPGLDTITVTSPARLKHP